MQLLGTCREAKGRLLKKAESAYGKRFKKFAKWKKQFQTENKRFELRFYCFVPSIAMFLDEGEKEYGDALVVVSMN